MAQLKVISIGILALVLTSCASEQEKVVYVDRNSSDITSTIKKATPILNKEYTGFDEKFQNYVYSVDYKLSTTEDHMVDITLCFNQNPKYKVIEKEVLNFEEYNSISYDKSNCTTSSVYVDTSKEDYKVSFDVLKIAHDLDHNQQIQGEVDVYSFLNDSSPRVMSLGKFNVEKIIPHIEVKSVDYDNLYFDGGFDFDKNLKPENVIIPIKANVLLHGVGADQINVKNSLNTISVTDINNNKIGNLNFKIDNATFTANKINAAIKNSDTIKKVETINSISSTSNSGLPYVGLSFNIIIPMNELNDFIPNVNSEGVLNNSNLIPTEAILSFDVSSNVNEKIVATTSKNINIVDAIYDVKDIITNNYNNANFKGINNNEFEPVKMFNNQKIAAKYSANYVSDYVTEAKEEKFNPIEYIAHYNQSRGDGLTYHTLVDFLGAVYTEQDPTTKRYGLVAETSGLVEVTVLNNTVKYFDSVLRFTASPEQVINGELKRPEVSFLASIEALGKVIAKEKMGINGDIHFNKQYSFEKEYSVQDTVILVVPFSYKVGGRGEVGMTPNLKAAIINRTLEVPGKTFIEIDNPTPQPEKISCAPLKSITLIDKLKTNDLPSYAIENMTESNILNLQKVKTYIFDEQDKLVQDYIISNNLSGTYTYTNLLGEEVVAMSEENAKTLTSDWNKREKLCAAYNNWTPKIKKVIPSGTVEKTALGLDFVVQAKPFVNVEGYGFGGLGIAKDWSLLKFDTGIGVEAALTPLVKADLDLDVNSFIGIAGADPKNPVDTNELILKLKYSSPFTYDLLHGKVWAGFNLLAQVKLLAWIDIVNVSFGKTLVDNSVYKGVIETVEPFEKTWAYPLPKNIKYEVIDKK